MNAPVRSSLRYFVPAVLILVAAVSHPTGTAETNVMPPLIPSSVNIASATAIATPEPIRPTPTPSNSETPPTTGIERPAGHTAATPIPRPVVIVGSNATRLLDRFGVVGNLADIEAAAASGLRFGNFIFWRTSAALPPTPGVRYWQTVRLGQVGEWGEWPGVAEEMALILREQPGSVWLVGNEPDVRWQDNVTAAEYAEAYHDIYRFIKSRDPTAKVAAGGIAQPSPLRLRYLDNVLSHYRARYGRAFPADMWHIHAFTLREEAGGWGVGIPPGMDGARGELYDIADHGDLDLFKQHITTFRDWMAVNGYADRPLAVTEFGILLPEDMGFPPDAVADYLRGAFDFFREATGEQGLAADDGRLVQVAFWYSLNDSTEYVTGNLIDVTTGRPTRLGRAYQSYILTLLAGTNRHEVR